MTEKAIIIYGDVTIARAFDNQGTTTREKVNMRIVMDPTGGIIQTRASHDENFKDWIEFTNDKPRTNPQRL